MGDSQGGRLDKQKARQLAADLCQCGGCIFFDWLHNDHDWGLCAQFNRIVFEHDLCTEWRSHPWGWSRPSKRPDSDPDYYQADPSDPARYSLRFLRDEWSVEPPVKPFWWEEEDGRD